MELKRSTSVTPCTFCILLIVPYGIETTFVTTFLECAVLLLIVPYGIETTKNASCSSSLNSLLIVPYGIETLELRLLALEQILLIVPYGIETSTIACA